MLHVVHRCITHYKLSAVNYDLLTHSRHNAGDRSAKVGHEINVYVTRKHSITG